MVTPLTRYVFFNLQVHRHDVAIVACVEEDTLTVRWGLIIIIVCQPSGGPCFQAVAGLPLVDVDLLAC